MKIMVVCPDGKHEIIELPTGSTWTVKKHSDGVSQLIGQNCGPGISENFRWSDNGCFHGLAIWLDDSEDGGGKRTPRVIFEAQEEANRHREEGGYFS